MHLFRLLFHFPFCHESLLKCLFDWNRPCCSHTLLLTALHPAITSCFLSLSFSSSVAELERRLASLLLSSLITYLHSFSLHRHQMKEAPPHLLSLLVFVCFMLALDRESWGVLYWEIQLSLSLSLPALILDNRRRTCYSQFNYWQFCMQRCMWMCVDRGVCLCADRRKEDIWTTDLSIYKVSSKMCF